MIQKPLDYQQSKIFKLTSSQTDKVYVGGTVESLEFRFRCHLKEHQMKKPNVGPQNIFKFYPDVQITLIEDYPCDSKLDLRKRQQEIMNEYGDRCCNLQSAIFDKKNVKRRKRACPICNTDVTSSYMKQHQKTNRCRSVASNKQKFGNVGKPTDDQKHT